MYEFHANFASIDFSLKLLLNFMPFYKRNWVASHRNNTLLSRQETEAEKTSHNSIVDYILVICIFHPYDTNKQIKMCQDFHGI